MSKEFLFIVKESQKFNKKLVFIKPKKFKLKTDEIKAAGGNIDAFVNRQ